MSYLILTSTLFNEVTIFMLDRDELEMFVTDMIDNKWTTSSSKENK